MRDYGNWRLNDVTKKRIAHCEGHGQDAQAPGEIRKMKQSKNIFGVKAAAATVTGSAAPDNPEGCQRVAGGRSKAETSGMHVKRIPHPRGVQES